MKAVKLPPSSFRALCKASGLPLPVEEFRFHPTRRWRADFAWLDEKVLLEVEGGAWSGGRHTRGSGYLQDMEKYNAATQMGWRLFRVTPQTLCSDATLMMLREALSCVDGVSGEVPAIDAPESPNSN